MFEFKKSTKFMTSFATDIECIKSELCNIGNSYLSICFRVWEIDTNKSYERAGYKSTVEALEKEVGFKKSTVYNMIKVVKTYGADKDGHISFHQLYSYNKFSYSQLVEMLSLGSEQREQITPETPVSAIRMLKKSEKTPAPEASASPVPSAEEFQTSGKSDDDPYGESWLESFFHDSNELHVLIDGILDNCSECFFDRFDPDQLHLHFNYIITQYRAAYKKHKQQDLKDKPAV